MHREVRPEGSLGEKAFAGAEAFFMCASAAPEGGFYSGAVAAWLKPRPDTNLPDTNFFDTNLFTTSLIHEHGSTCLDGLQVACHPRHGGASLRRTAEAAVPTWTVPA